MLKPVKCQTAVDAAIDHIGKYIADNMRPGDVLPSERELAEQLQISRNITREALQHFRTLGIIESKPKIGATIASFYPEDVYAGYKPFLAIQQHTFQDLAHLRLTLELGCAERAIKNVSAKDIEELTALSQKILDLAGKVTSAKDENAALLDAADVEFHTRIMKLSGNALINSLIPLVTEFFEKQFLQTQSPVKKRSSGYLEHFAMVEALQNGDLEKLSALIRAHLNTYMKNCTCQTKEA